MPAGGCTTRDRRGRLVSATPPMSEGGAQRGESISHVLLRQMQPGQRFGRRAVQALLTKRKAINPEMHVCIDEPRCNRPSAEVNDLGAVGSPNRAGHGGDGVSVDEELAIAGQG